ncbi:hypothetical protein GCM10010156_19580 [Planobispora rosea]|uniref:Uncharacterized protein n=1 Tax=Planobispora rosea TaxID=35762 RepID=A0A8J3WCE1_PLARO|nr:hypothetical protein [Planobispora rosea]GGS60921.1 hypothetical protein GCM10010156_19580 [Planobispora rosea]GIH83943.1 hypothetical protein Pro02_23510 [Planobispora rosea]
MSDDSGTERYLRLTVELTVEVQDLGALQAAALSEIEHPDADLDDDERREQAEMVSADETGATALQWLIEPDHVLSLIEHVDQVEPREAILSVEPSDGPSDEDDDHDHDGHGHGHGH